MATKQQVIEVVEEWADMESLMRQVENEGRKSVCEVRGVTLHLTPAKAEILGPKGKILETHAVKGRNRGKVASQLLEAAAKHAKNSGR